MRSGSGSLVRPRAAAAAAVYFALVFAAGTLSGTVRILLAVPRMGPIEAVALEIPLMLLVSWLACGYSIRKFRLEDGCDSLLAGAGAFALLMMAELALAVLAFGKSPMNHFRGYLTPEGGLGLAGQILFGAMPPIRWWLSRWRRS